MITGSLTGVLCVADGMLSFSVLGLTVLAVVSCRVANRLVCDQAKEAFDLC